MAQTDAILAALESGRRLTALDALKDFGCLRLGARVWDLRQEGHEVESEMVKLPSGKRVARYWLERPAREGQLAFG